MAVVLVTACVGCTPDAPVPSSSAPSTEPSAASPSTPVEAAPVASAGARDLLWPDGSVVGGPTLGVSEARVATKSDYTVVGEVGSRSRGSVVHPFAVLPGGALLVEVGPVDNYDEAADRLKEPAQMGLWEDGAFRSFGSTADAVPGDDPRQTYGAVASDGAVAWAETASTNLFTSDWRIFTHDLDAGGAPVLVAQAEDVYAQGDLPLAVGQPGPVIHGDRVYWQTTYQREDAAFRPTIVSTELGGGDLRTELDLGAMPASVDAGIVVQRMHDVTVEGADDAWGIQDPRRSTGIALIDDGGETRDILAFAEVTDDDWFVRELAGGGDTVALAMDHSLVVLGVEGGEVVRFDLPPGSRAGSLAVCGDRVTWTDVDRVEGSGTRQYVYNTATSDFVAVDTPQNSALSGCAGDIIYWTEFGDEGRVTTITRW